jgi:homoserine O-acetyltransferase
MTETYGELNLDKSNAVFVCTPFSGNHHAAGIKDGEKKPGWWMKLLEMAKQLIQKNFLLFL